MESIRGVLTGLGAVVLVGASGVSCSDEFSSSNQEPVVEAGVEAGTKAGAGSRGAGGAAGTSGASGGQGGVPNGAGGSASGGANGTVNLDASVIPDAPLDAAPEGAPPDAELDSHVPTDGLLLWLRADRGVTLENGTVASWADQSGNRAHATQSKAAQRPRLSANGIGGVPTVEFDGVDDYLTLPAGFADFTKGVSIFGITQTFQVPDNVYCFNILEFSNGPEVADISVDRNEGRLLYEVFEAYSDTNGAEIPIDTPEQIGIVHQADGNVSMRLNGAVTGAYEAPLPVNTKRQDNYIGKSLYTDCNTWHGQISEILVYARAVTSREILDIEYYLRSRSNCCSD